MNNSPLDDHIKKQFGNYSPDVPSHIWEKIAAEKDKRKPVGFWFNSLNKTSLFLLLGLLLLGTGAVMFNHFNNNTDKTSTATSINKKSTTEPGSTNNVQAENARSEYSEKENTITTERKPSETIQPTNQPTRIQNDPVAHTNNNVAISGSSNKKTIPDNTKNDVAVDNNVIDNSTDIKTTLNRFSKPKRSKGKALITLKNAAAVSEDESSTENISSKNILSENDLLLNRLLLDPQLLNTEKNILSTVKKPSFSFTNVPCPESEKNVAGNKRYFEVYAGPDYAFRSITDTGNSAYLQKRKESTKFSSAFSVGLRYTKVFNNGMSFRTGINYSQINEKFKYAEGNIIQVVYITNSNGDTTGSFISSGTRYKTTYNKFRTIDVPLMIGYELGNGRLHANFNAGAIINVYSWQKGDVLDTAYKPVNITTGKASSPYQFKTNVGVGFIGSVSLYYKLSNRLHILAEPYFRYNFSPASKADLTIKQKYSTAGLRLGVRIDF